MRLDGTFQEDVAKMAIGEDFLFGSQVPAPESHQTVISNITQLAEYFNPFSDNAAQNLINDQVWGINQPFNTTNFVFAPEFMNFVCTANQSVQPTCYCSFKNQSLFVADQVTQISLANTFNWPANAPIPQPWTLIAIAFSGIYLVRTVTGTTAATATITCNPWLGNGSTTINSGANGAAFLQIGLCKVTGISSNTVTVSNPPQSWCAAGNYAMAVVSGSYPTWTTPCTVTAVSPTSVTLSQIPPQLNTGANNWLMMVPQCNSGQIWRKKYVYPGFGGVKRMALRAVVQLPPSFGLRQEFTPTTLNPKSPVGSWPDFWLYSGTSRSGYSFDYSEIDILEVDYCLTQDPTMLSGNNHGQYLDDNGGLQNSTFYYDNLRCKSGSNAFLCEMGSYDLSAQIITVGIVADEEKVVHYLNDTPWTARDFRWSSAQPPQYSLGLAMGSVQNSLASNLFLPLSDAAFPVNYGIQRVTQYIEY